MFWYSSRYRSTYLCAKWISQFKNLILLSIHFTAQIELQEKIQTSKNSQSNIQQNFIQFILNNLLKLRKFYLNSCPVQDLKMESQSLEKFCLYRSEFVSIKTLKTPKLRNQSFTSLNCSDIRMLTQMRRAKNFLFWVNLVPKHL